MPQVLKEEVRTRILGSALQEFASRGYLGATMGGIAGRADVGTASLYRYYDSKDALFVAVVTPALAERFESLLERRVRALAKRVLGGGAPGEDDRGGELLDFWIANRLAVVVLLDRAEGTAYAHYGQRFVDHLVSETLTQIRAARPGVRIGGTSRFVLERIFENTRRMLASILEQHDEPRALSEAIEAFWSYQIPGLRGFTEWVTSES